MNNWCKVIKDKVNKCQYMSFIDAGLLNIMFKIKGEDINCIVTLGNVSELNLDVKDLSIEALDEWTENNIHDKKTFYQIVDEASSNLKAQIAMRIASNSNNKKLLN